MDEETLKTLLENAGRDGGRVYESLQKAISQMGNSALPALAWALQQGPRWGIRRAAVIGLGMLKKSDETVALLTQALDDPANAVGQAARRQLQRLGEGLDITPQQIIRKFDPTYDTKR